MKYKKELIISITIILISILLCIVGTFNNIVGFDKISLTIITSFILVFYTIKVEKKLELNNGNKVKTLENLDLIRYLLSIIVIIVHIRPFLGVSHSLDVLFNNIISRICVPMFFLVTGYFVAKKTKNDSKYIKKYIVGMLPLYLSWSIIYIPITVLWSHQYNHVITNFISTLNFNDIFTYIIAIISAPIALLVGLLYSGTFYHLWYFPALILALFLLYLLRKKLNIKFILGIAFVLLLFGATETYYGVVPGSIKQIINHYFSIFITTRNFLFFGLFYVTLGFYMSDHDEYKKYSFLKCLISFILLFVEAMLLQKIDRLNSNILLFSIPTVYYLFYVMLYSKPFTKLSSKYNFRELYKYYYLVHAMLIVFLDIITNSLKPSYLLAISKIVIVLIATHILSIFIIKIKKKYKKLVI